MSCQRGLKIWTEWTMLALTGVMVFASVSPALEKTESRAKGAQQEKSQQISRLELQNDLMRFAQMFIRGFSREIYFIERQDVSDGVRFALSNGELRTVNTLLAITTGPEAVVNLLDMVIFVTLARMGVENSWDASVFGKDKGKLPEFFQQMEKQIWTIAEKVLIPRYQKELRNLIQRWRARHPDQLYMAGVGFDRLSDMLEDSDFKDAAKSGFLLPEVNEATQSVDEARNLAERLVFFTKHLPYIVRTTTEAGIYDMLDQPEIIRVLTDIDRLTTAIEGIGLTAKQLPDKIGKEREKLMSDLLRSEDKLRALSGDFRQTLAAGDKTAASFNQAILSYDKLLSRMYARAKPGSFEIQEWLETLRQATEAAKQTQALVVMVDKLATDPGLEQRVTQLNRGLNALLQRAFLWTALVIVFFFLVLLAYRYLSQRFAGARPAS